MLHVCSPTGGNPACTRSHHEARLHRTWLAHRCSARRRRLVCLQQTTDTPGPGGTARPARFGDRALRRARRAAYPRRERRPTSTAPSATCMPRTACSRWKPCAASPAANWPKCSGRNCSTPTNCSAACASVNAPTQLRRQSGSTVAGVEGPASLSGWHQPISGHPRRADRVRRAGHPQAAVHGGRQHQRRRLHGLQLCGGVSHRAVADLCARSTRAPIT